MEREIDLAEVSDGKLYSANDLVKVGCGDCAGCSSCCRETGNTIILDPYDIWQLERGTGMTFTTLMEQGKIELNMADGVILPNLKLAEDGSGCGFLNAQGRCSIHPFRPGLCRLFPLGRLYEENGFRYFIQIHECSKENRSKVKVKKWLEIPDIRRYETFVLDWHDYLKKVGSEVKRTEEEARMKELTMSVLRLFFLKPYAAEDFYGQFYERLETVR
ncbi:MAG TPA: YkgJ family cysteine cluster protein [Candidatus Eisenbergiella merdipullorum]|uniref:YkgJ family cysteine cluster protein n=1 Tax=Candidatus Eisenbergiella merdipullorum TaxID=2838553 RepID=A0A9D2I4X1_9FIRM|nr:YkgJ family cysteine cluster protein [Candidatus Eisenbergiella merdipullorum]